MNDFIVETTISQHWMLEQTGKFAAFLGYMGGKTYGGFLKIDYEAALNKAAVPQNELERLYVGKDSAWLITEPVASMIATVLVPKIEEFCKNMDYKWHFVKKFPSVDILIDAHGYSYYLYLRSAQNYLRWEGMQGTIEFPILGGWMDEGASNDYPEAWEYFVRRVTRFKTDATRFVTGTPPIPSMRTYSQGDNYWVYKKITNIHEGTTMENIFMPDPEGYAKQIIEEVGETLARALVHGEKVEMLSGRLFWAYKPEKHLVEKLPLNEKYLKELNISFDFNVNCMTALLYTFHEGVLYIYRVFRGGIKVGTRIFTRKICNEYIRKYCKDLHKINITGDPSGYWATSSSEVDVMDRSLSNYDILVDEILIQFKGRIHSRDVNVKAAKHAPTVSGSADVVNVMLEKNLVKIVKTDKWKIIDDDLKRDPNTEKDRDIWKKKYPESSHASDNVRYIVYTEFGDIRSFDSEYRQKTYEDMRVE